MLISLRSLRLALLDGENGLMKRLIIVSGTMGVGKTSTCSSLYRMAPRTVWLDGDWCWLMNPWDMCEENRRMAMSNIIWMLRAYLKNSTFDNVVFSWVLHRQEIIDELMDGLDGLDFTLNAYVLTCSPQALEARMLGEGRSRQQLHDSLDRMPLYSEIGWPQVNTDGMDCHAAAARIANLSGMCREGGEA